MSIVYTVLITAVVVFIGTLFAVKRNPKLMSVIGAYDSLVKKVKEI